MPPGTFGIFWRQRNMAHNHPECIRAELQKAKFNGAWIYEANMGRANLSEAEFNNDPNGGAVRAQGINLSYSTLIGAQFIGANLKSTNERVTNLEGANLTNANLTDTDLRGAGWLEPLCKESNYVEQRFRLVAIQAEEQLVMSR
jgi:uncharacterized protein YjbI with pentapeptide repeats